MRKILSTFTSRSPLVNTPTFKLSTINERKMGFYQFCRHRNYPIKQYLIKTKDHYQLKFYRIQQKGTNIVNSKKVVYLQHGLCDSSDTWVRNSENLAPGFILANQGYDVWLGNTRGNTYSTPQLSPAVHADKYWDFSFDQMAEFDLPAAFQFIGKETNRRINYVGHSQGTLIMFIALSQNNKTVSDRLASFSALGPVAYLQNVSPLLKMVVATPPKILLHALQLLSPHIPLLTLDLDLMQDLQNTRVVKNHSSIIDFATNTVLDKFVDEKHQKINNLQSFDDYKSRFPAGSSSKNFAHFAQYVSNGGGFCKYDYGLLNLKKYGSLVPPKYDLSKITFPVNLFVGSNDKLATPEDNERIQAELKNTICKKEVIPEYGHISFLISKNTEAINRVLKVIKQSKE